MKGWQGGEEIAIIKNVEDVNWFRFKKVLAAALIMFDVG